jgi:hypothetical protein
MLLKVTGLRAKQSPVKSNKALETFFHDRTHPLEVDLMRSYVQLALNYSVHARDVDTSIR